MTRSLWQHWFSSYPHRLLSHRCKGAPTPSYFYLNLLPLEERALLSCRAASFLAGGWPASIAVDGGSRFTASAKYASINMVTNYTGTVHVTIGVGQAILAANATLTSGTVTFQALKTAGRQSITATGTIASSITESESGNVVNAVAGLREVCG